ncbi:MAG: hypothetical protein JW891_18495 [Candidatus Lokiarchaeota archaeon]|nr:hypothetical protein [Candidatus Lokiarchaeota archaeon]
MKSIISKNRTISTLFFTIFLFSLSLGFTISFGGMINGDARYIPMSSNVLKTSQSPDWSSEKVAICTKIGEQYKSESIIDEDGNIFVVWRDNRNDVESFDWDIFVQKINSSTGTVQWTENGVAVCVSSEEQHSYKLISDGAGGVIIVWEDFRNDYSDIYAQRIDPIGNPLWTPNGTIVCNSISCQYNPGIINDGSGGAIIVWEDYRSGSGKCIYAQRINSTGHAQWTANGTVIRAETESQTNPILINDGYNNAIIAWVEYSDPSILFVQKINSSGQPQWTPEGVIISTDVEGYQFHKIISDGLGGAIITWEDIREGENDENIYAQRLNSSGYEQWASGGLSVCNSTNSQTSPFLISDGSGGAIIIWEDARNGNYHDIYAQKINRIGQEQWTNNGVTICFPWAHSSFHQSQKATEFVLGLCGLVSDETGGTIISWKEWNGNTGRIYAQKIDTKGNTQWKTNGATVYTGYSVSSMNLVSDGSGGAVVIWAESSYPDIYCKHIPSQGFPESSAIAGYELHIILASLGIVMVVIGILRIKKRNFQHELF